MYIPLNYDAINAIEGSYSPSMVKNLNTAVFDYWVRSLFQRACSVIEFEDLPKTWTGPVRDFFYYCLFRFGFVAVFKRDDVGLVFNPGTLYGRDFYYQPTNMIVTNPSITESLDMRIGSECELLKLTPDYRGIWDIITYYAEKLATLDSAINMSIINSKLAYILAARNKAAAQALKKMLDKINSGEPAVIIDMKLLNDPDDKAEPWQFLDRPGLKESYLTPEQLQDFSTILNNFDMEIGIPVLPYAKKERMVAYEAESRVLDATSRSRVWVRTLRSSIESVRKLYPEFRMTVKPLYEDAEEKEGDEDNDGDAVDSWTV